jgi:hypothetical protein
VADPRLSARSLYSRDVNGEFNWWLLIVGLVIGAGVVWLILADSARREVDVEQRERAGEARWIAEELRRAGRTVTDETVLEVLDLHAAYLGAPPPDQAEGEESPPEASAVTPPTELATPWVQVDEPREGERRPV